MNRRDTLLALLALSAPAELFAADAKSSDKMRRLGVLMGYAESDTEAQIRFKLFTERLAALGWVEGRNLKIDLRWTASDVGRAEVFAKELVALQPEVILSNTTPATAALQRATRSIPIVFTVVSDPVGSGFVKSLSRPGGNITGFINLESTLMEKWLQLLKELAPRMTRAAVMYNPQTAPYADYYLEPLKIAAPKIGVKTFTALVRSESDIENVIKKLGAEPGSGLIAMTDSFVFVNRKSIIALAARHKVPAMYYVGNMVEEGGLISYGVDYHDLFRRAATYVDRIFRGTKAADLPVEQPAKFELVINMKIAKALGLTVPPTILVRADKVIE